MVDIAQNNNADGIDFDDDYDDDDDDGEDGDVNEAKAEPCILFAAVLHLLGPSPLQVIMKMMLKIVMMVVMKIIS